MVGIRDISKVINYRSFSIVQLMFFNNRTNNVQENDRGQSTDCGLFSFTGVRFFEPKFLNSLNKPSFPDISISKTSSQVRLETFKSPKNSRIIEKESSKQNSTLSFSRISQKKSEITSKKKLPENKICRIRGLNNIGNTCYMNSILQCLLNLTKFNSELTNELFKCKSMKNDVTFQYANLVQQFIQSHTNSPFVPSKLKSSIGKKKNRFMGHGQQDAQQFLTAFLQISNQEMSRIKQKPKYLELQNNPNKKSIKALSQQWWEYNKMRDDSIICDNFQGQLISAVTCKKCRNQSVTFDNIWGLPLSLSKTTYSVSDLIRKNWSLQNQISDYYCSVCRKHRDCTKKLQFFKLPQVLVIQLKRFDYGKWKKDKIKTSVKLSDTLNIGEFLNKNAQSQSHLYKLSGMVHHYGQVDYGHYNASVYKENERKWHLVNDSKTSQNIPDSPSNTVYLLFYVRM